MTLEQYFAQSNAPAASSPIGLLMVKVMAKYPAYSFQDAREHAQRLLTEAAGKRVYRSPRVMSASEIEANQAEAKAYWASRKAKDAA